jgi:SAM-dependent methyltransferase
MLPLIGEARKKSAYTQERISFWDAFARAIGRWERSRRYYHRQLALLFQFSVPPGLRVLEVGSGPGDLLAALRPAYGVGIDLSPEMVELARTRHPALRFEQADAHDFDLGEKFDVIVCSDLVNDLWDVQTAFDRIRVHCHSSTRLLINSYSRLWEGPRKLAELVGLVQRLLPQNWLTVEDIANLLHLSRFEVIRQSPEIMLPVPVPLLATLANRYIVRLWPLSHLGITNMLAARLQPGVCQAGVRERDMGERQDATVSVIVPARNEEGNIPGIFDRLPQMGAGTELIVVEGHSIDNTYAAAEREIARRPGYPARLLRQTGQGKGDAVRLGFSQARGELLMILDADLTVMPEDLPRFYEAWRTGVGEFINGVRLVYPMEDQAMRFFNMLGNKFFSIAFTWLLGQVLKDTLCGVKATASAATVKRTSSAGAMACC